MPLVSGTWKSLVKGPKYIRSEGPQYHYLYEHLLVCVCVPLWLVCVCVSRCGLCVYVCQVGVDLHIALEARGSYWLPWSWSYTQ